MNGKKSKRPTRGACGRGVGVGRRLCLGDALRANAPSRADARVRDPGRRPLGRLSWECAEVVAVECHANRSIRVCESGVFSPGAHCTMINGESQPGVSKCWKGCSSNPLWTRFVARPRRGRYRAGCSIRGETSRSFVPGCSAERLTPRPTAPILVRDRRNERGAPSKSGLSVLRGPERPRSSIR